MSRATLIVVSPWLLITAGCEGMNTAGQVERAPTPTAAVVTGWNDRLLAIAEEEDGFLTLKGVRTAAMMHLAMHDALARIEPRYRPFGSSGTQVTSNPVAVASEAAYAVALSQYPERKAVWEEERVRWLKDGDPDRQSRVVELGNVAAVAVLEARVGDGWNSEPTYEWHPMGPGVYAEFSEHSETPEGFVFGAGWGAARPFALDHPAQFRSPPPPDIESDAYTRAFNEVKEVGALESKTRTADQAHLAMWWKEFVEKSHNRLARELVQEAGLDLWRAARLFALLNVSIFDGYVASFDAKFHYNHWRPYTAIRWAENDGNPDTREDREWTNLHDHTYAFPSYPSAHGTVCAAAMTVLENAFGTRFPFEMTIREVDAGGPMSGKVPMHPATRSFEDFGQAAEECANSRIYLGIHFRYDSEEGSVLGRRVGKRVLAEVLQPRR